MLVEKEELKVEYKKFTGSFAVEGKCALVTGAASGIGKAAARLFAGNGSRLVMVDISPEVEKAANELRSGYGAEVLAVVCDLTAPGEIDKLIGRALKEFGRIDILVNVAGICILSPAEDLPEQVWDRIMDLNLKYTFRLCQAAGKSMIESGGGRIVNVASQGGVIATDKHTAYSVSKAGLIHMTKSIALEWAKYNINVNAVSPTVVLTELGERLWQGEEAELMKKKIPCGRFLYPDEVAAVILFLSCDASNMITGENIMLDGGYTIQ